MRPTPAKVKEALFSIVGGERIAGARVLDLYAGSGAIGFEALSRGAAHVTFVEMNAATAAAIKRTADQFGVAKRTSVICAPAETAAKRVAAAKIDILVDLAGHTAGNRLGLFVPCHRVVAAGGLGSYGSHGLAYKRKLLELEGAI